MVAPPRYVSCDRGWVQPVVAILRVQQTADLRTGIAESIDHIQLHPDDVRNRMKDTTRASSPHAGLNSAGWSPKLFSSTIVPEK